MNLKNQQSSLPGLLGTAAVRGALAGGGLVRGADAASGSADLGGGLGLGVQRSGQGG